jgi:hypothetical protein
LASDPSCNLEAWASRLPLYTHWDYSPQKVVQLWRSLFLWATSSSLTAPYCWEWLFIGLLLPLAPRQAAPLLTHWPVPLGVGCRDDSLIKILVITWFLNWVHGPGREMFWAQLLLEMVCLRKKLVGTSYHHSTTMPPPPVS